MDIDAKLLEGSAKKRGGTKREHRIRIYVEEYEKIGFHFPHKNELLKLLSDYNRSLTAQRKKKKRPKKK